MHDGRALLLSIRPRYARAILDGTKTVEVRRRAVRALPGTPVVLYATTPTMAVVGTAVLGEALVCDPETAWREHHLSLGLARDEFDAYVSGVCPCLLFLNDVASLDDPIRLEDLQRRWASFRPPQSYRYLSGADPEAVRGLVRSSSGLAF